MQRQLDNQRQLNKSSIIFEIVFLFNNFCSNLTFPMPWDSFIYYRDNPKGKHSELWHHISGCRQWFKVLRDTASHEIFKTAKLSEEL